MPGLRSDIGQYLAALLGAAVLLALGPASADAAFTLSKLRMGGPTGSENYTFAAENAIHAEGSVDSSRSYRFVVTDPSGVAQSTSACRTSTGGSATNAYTVRAIDSPSATTAWSYRLEQFTSSICEGVPEKTDRLYFTVARATAYSDPAGTLPKSAFPSAATVYVQVAGMGKVDASGNVTATSDWDMGWQRPDGVWICANTGGGDRPDSTSAGLLPASSLTPGTGSTLRYQPFATSTGDVWNRQSSYDGAVCPELGAANEGQWRIGLQRDSTHFVVLPVFTVDATAPDTTITGGPSGISSATTASFGLDASEAGVAFECSLDSGAWAPCSTPAEFTGLADGPHTLSVRATDPAGNVDPVPAARTWTVDASAPAVTLTTPENGSFTNDQTPAFSGAAGTNAGNGAVTVKISEGSGTSGAVIQELAATGSPTWATTADPALPEGTYTARAEQAGSGSTGVSAQHTFTVDTTAPSVTLVSPTEGFRTNDPTASLRGTLGTDPGDDATATVEVFSGSTATGAPLQAPAVTVTDGRWSAAPAALGEGTYTVSVLQTDTAGNAATATHTFAVDLTPPDTIITASSGAATASTEAHFELLSPDEVAGFECRLDGGLWLACASAPSYGNLAPGQHTFEARAIDAAGNVDPEPASLTWTIDLSLPLVAVTAPVAGAVLSDTTPTFEGTAGTGPGDDVRVQVRIYSTSAPNTLVQTGETTRSPSGDWTVSAAPLPDGSYFARAVQRSSAGWASSPARSFRIDTGAPDTAITSGVPGPTTSTAATFGFEADEDGASFECRLDGGDWTACTSPTAYSGLTPGSHTFAVRAIDVAGITDATPATQTWLVEPALPAVTLTLPAGGAATSDTTPTFAGLAGTSAGDDGLVTVRISSGGAPIQSITAVRGAIDGSWSAAATTPLAEGEYLVHAEQEGTAGTAYTPTRVFTVDTTPPQASLLSGPNGTTASDDPRFSFTANEPGATFDCRLDGGAWESCEPPTAYSDLAPGDHTFSVRAVDAAGNVDPSPPVREWTIAAGAPLALTAPAHGAVTNDPTPAFAGAASISPDDAADVTVEVYPGASAVAMPAVTLTTPRSPSDGSWSVPSETLPDGTYTVLAKQVDALGENVVVTAAHTFRVDTWAPAPHISAPVSDTATPHLTGTAGTAPGDDGTVTVTLYEGTAAGGTVVQTLANVAVGAGGAWAGDADTLPDGTYTVRAAQGDSAGNTGLSAPVTFVVDTAPPDPPVDPGPSDPVPSDPVPGTVPAPIPDGGSSAGGESTAPTATPIAALPDTAAPVIGPVRMAKLFVVTRGATAVSARVRRFPRGTRIAFDLSESATVQIVLERVLGGRPVRYVAAGRLTRRNLPAGRNAIRFTGRVGRRALRAGRYRAVLTATDAAGNRSLPRRVAFRIARAAPSRP